MPGVASFKLPAMLLLIAVLGRTIGAGALAQMRSEMKAIWIIGRVFFDYLTNADGIVDVWYWAFCISMLRPMLKFKPPDGRSIIGMG